MAPEVGTSPPSGEGPELAPAGGTEATVVGDEEFRRGGSAAMVSAAKAGELPPRRRSTVEPTGGVGGSEECRWGGLAAMVRAAKAGVLPPRTRSTAESTGVVGTDECREPATTWVQEESVDTVVSPRGRGGACRARAGGAPDAAGLMAPAGASCPGLGGGGSTLSTPRRGRRPREREGITVRERNSAASRNGGGREGAQ